MHLTSWLAQEPIIAHDTFAQVQQLLAAHSNSSQSARRTRNRYLLRSLNFYGICRCRMQGQHAHGSVYYRCRFPQEYALSNRIDHPAT